jgi:hypothetical protein
MKANFSNRVSRLMVPSEIGLRIQETQCSHTLVAHAGKTILGFLCTPIILAYSRASGTVDDENFGRTLVVCARNLENVERYDLVTDHIKLSSLKRQHVFVSGLGSLG